MRALVFVLLGPLLAFCWPSGIRAQTSLTPPLASLAITSQELTVEFFPRTQEVSVEAQLWARNPTGLPLPELIFYLSPMARAVQVTAEDFEDIPFRREYTGIAYFERVVLLPLSPLTPGQERQLKFRYRLRFGDTREVTGLGWNTALGAENSYLLDAWYPTSAPVLDTRGFLGRLPKVPTRLRVLHGDGLTAISCGHEESDSIFALAETVPVTIPVVLGRYRRVSRVLGGIPIEFYLSPPAAQTVEERRLLQLGKLVADTVRQNEHWFGVLARDRIRVVLGDFRGAARGFPFLLLLPTNFLRNGLDAEKRAIVCHEMSHTWFGNAVTGIGPGGNEWLNEGLATWVSALHLEHIDGRETAVAMLREWRTELFDSTLEPTPLVELKPLPNLLTKEGYLKGALVLNELRKEVGLSQLVRGIRNWFRDYRGSFSTLEDFERTLSTVVGRDLRPFFDQWLRSTRLPRYRIVRWNVLREATEHRLDVTIENRGSGSGFIPLAIHSPADVTHRMLVSAAPESTVTLVSYLPYTVEAVELDPDRTALSGLRWKSWLSKARILRKEGQLVEAERILRQIAAEVPEASEVWYQLGRVEQDQGDTERALTSYATAIACARNEDWSGIWSHIRRAQIYDRTGSPRNAEKELRQVLEGDHNPFGARERARELLVDLRAANPAEG